MIFEPISRGLARMERVATLLMLAIDTALASNNLPTLLDSEASGNDAAERFFPMLRRTVAAAPLVA